MKRGFTLLELVLVILIILIIIGISAPLFRRSFSSYELDNFTASLVKTIGYLREISILERAVYKVEFDADAKKYALYRVETGTEGDLVFTPAAGRFGKAFAIPKQVSVTFTAETVNDKENLPEARPEIFIYPDGTTDKKYIVFKDDTAGDNITLSLDGTTGEAKIETKQ